MSIEKTISQFIKTQFPRYYQDNGENFVNFVVEYYKWLEEDSNLTYHSRRLLDYKDIDETVNDFVVYFKSKYTQNIQYETESDYKKLIKYALNIYRSKGTERSIDLFFKLVFGKPADVYYPGNDIFKLSVGDWKKQNYLEVSSTPVLTALIGKQIVGFRSGATAFVERSVRRKIASKWVDILYISSIHGDFESGEKVYIQGSYSKQAPTVLGSLTSFDILSGGREFSVGDIVEIYSENGVGAKARVASISNVTGVVDFKLIDGGWGYTVNSDILISERIITIANVEVSTNNIINTFLVFDTLKQPLLNIAYNSANSTFPNSTVLYTYYGNGSVSSTMTVLAGSNSSATNGELFVSIKGDFSATEPSSNASINVAIIERSQKIVTVGKGTQQTGTANVSVGRRLIIGNGTFFDNEYIKQQSANLGQFNVNSSSNSVISSNNIMDVDYFNTYANLSGTISVNSTSKNVIGTNTTFSTDFSVGDYISVYNSNSIINGYSTRYIESITNNTLLIVNSAFVFTNSSANYTQGDLRTQYLSLYTNSTVLESRVITKVINATHFTVLNNYLFTNSSANGVMSGMEDYIVLGDSTKYEIREVNNYINSTALWLTYPTLSVNSVAAHYTPSWLNGQWLVRNANATGTVSYKKTNNFIVGTSTNFTDCFANGDSVLLFANSVATGSVLVPIREVINSTFIKLDKLPYATNLASGGIAANVVANTSFYYGKKIAIFANGTNYDLYTVNNAINNRVLVLQSNSILTNATAKFASTNTNTYFYTTGNSSFANAVTITDKTALANIIGTGSNGFLYTTNNVVQFEPNTYVFQINSTGYEISNAYITSATYSGLDTTISFNEMKGVFHKNLILYNKYANGVNTAANASINSITVMVGVYDIENDFSDKPNNYVYGITSLSNGTITRISRQTVPASFDISSNSLSYTEDILFYSDLILPYANVWLDADNFYPPGSNLISTPMATANILTPLIDAFQNTTITIGRINNLTAINPGSGYDTAPMVVIHEPLIAPANKKDWILTVNSINGVFTIGEILQQNSVDVGLIKSYTNTEIYVKRLNYTNPFINSHSVMGLSSGANATIIKVGEQPNILQIGLNAEVSANVQTGNGVVTTLESVDSGYGYLHNETVSFVSNDGLRSGSAIGYLGKQGIDSGKYKNRDGFLSNSKKLHDGNYYQEYSYEIQTTATLDQYEEMIRNVMHVAGTKMFGAVISPSLNDVSLEEAAITKTINGNFTASIINNSNSVTTSNTQYLRVGDNLSGSGIPANTKVANISSNSAFTMTKLATASNSAVTFTYTR